MGYRVPPQDTFTALLKADGGKYGNAQSIWDATHKVYTSTSISPTGSTVTFSVSGYVGDNDGTLKQADTFGHYWCSSPLNDSGVNVNAFTFSSLAAGTIAPVYGRARTYGFPVRCVREFD